MINKVGQGDHRRNRRRDDRFDPARDISGGVDHAVRVIGIVDQPDCAIDPDGAGNADDIIDDVAIVRGEAG